MVSDKCQIGMLWGVSYHVAANPETPGSKPLTLQDAEPIPFGNLSGGKGKHLDLCILFGPMRSTPNLQPCVTSCPQLGIPSSPEQVQFCVQDRRGECGAGGAAQLCVPTEDLPCSQPTL